MEATSATFRPPPRPATAPVLLGAGAGLALGLLLDAPVVFALFGGVAAWIAVSAREARGLRAVADPGGLRVLGLPPPAAGRGAGHASPFEARWEELRLGFGFAARDGGEVQRYAILADPRGRLFAFAEQAGRPPCHPIPGPGGEPVPVVDLREAAHLLALVVQRTPAWNVFPGGLAPAPVAAAAGSGEGTPSPAAGTPEVAAPSPAAAQAARRGRYGLLGLGAKLGSKLLGALTKVGAGAAKAVQTTKLGWAAASVATYSLFFSWKFAVALMVQLFVHEYGHVHAMRRTGMRVRGMYFIPFLGALAVTEDAFTSRRQQAYVALNGPLWGSLLTLLPLGLWSATGEPAWSAVAVSWAVLNLFNLLPFAPLDGGRILQALAASWSSRLGLAVSVGGLAVVVAVGLATGFSMIWFLAALGALELLGQAGGRAGARALQLLPEPGRLGPLHWVYLRALAGPPPGGPDEGRFLAGLERAQAEGRAAPMTARQALGWGLAYVGLSLALVALVWALRTVPGGAAAAGILE